MAYNLQPGRSTRAAQACLKFLGNNTEKNTSFALPCML